MLDIQKVQTILNSVKKETEAEDLILGPSHYFSAQDEYMASLSSSNIEVRLFFKGKTLRDYLKTNDVSSKNEIKAEFNKKSMRFTEKLRQSKQKMA